MPFGISGQQLASAFVIGVALVGGGFHIGSIFYGVGEYIKARLDKPTETTA